LNYLNGESTFLSEFIFHFFSEAFGTEICAYFLQGLKLNEDLPLPSTNLQKVHLFLCPSIPCPWLFLYNSLWDSIEDKAN